MRDFGKRNPRGQVDQTLNANDMAAKQWVTGSYQPPANLAKQNTRHTVETVRSSLNNNVLRRLVSLLFS